MLYDDTITRAVANRRTTHPSAYSGMDQRQLPPHPALVSRASIDEDMPYNDVVLPRAHSWERQNRSDFFSPFATESLMPFSGGDTPGGRATPQPAGSVDGELHEASAAVVYGAHARVRQISRALMDIVGSLTPLGSEILRSASAVIVPVVPASIYVHTIGARPSFEGLQQPARNFNFILVSLGLLLGLVGLAIWSAIESK